VRLVQEILSVGSRCDLKATHVIFWGKAHDVNLSLTIKIPRFERPGSGNTGILPFGRRAWFVGAQWSCGMSRREAQEDNLLSAFALTIGGALGVSVPMTLVIIWLCS
jgi:hypothetical protein